MNAFADTFAELERQYGLPSGYLARTAQIESANNPNARNPNSSATGLFQFINSTARQYGLNDPTDPIASSDAAARLARDNAAVLRRVLGREPTAAELYLAHQQGAGGASKLLSNPNARAVDIVGRDAVRFNAGRENMTAAEFAQRGLGYFSGNRGGGSTPQQPQVGNAFAVASAQQRQEPEAPTLDWQNNFLDPAAFQMQQAPPRNYLAEMLRT